LIGTLAGAVGSGVLLGIAAGVADRRIFATTLVYCVCLLTMLACSAAYNLAADQSRRGFLRRLDHAAIFVMIAGTYTPFTTCRLNGIWAIGMTGAVWTGAVGGAVVGGPVGAAVGGVTGALVGGALSGPDQTKFRSYVVREHRPSVKMREQDVVGTPLPPAVEIYEVPEEVGVRTNYSYSIVNDRTVLVDPKTRKIVQIIE
jgi:hypothetical protein